MFYVSQVQRKLPTAELVDFFSAQQPEYTARLGGVDFAQVYRSPILLSGQAPAVEQTLADARLGDGLRLAGYALGAERATPGHDLDVTLYWLPEAQLGADYDFTLRLADDGWPDRLAAGPASRSTATFPPRGGGPAAPCTAATASRCPPTWRPATTGWPSARTDPATGQSLPASGPTAAGRPDSLVIGPIAIE